MPSANGRGGRYKNKQTNVFEGNDDLQPLPLNVVKHPTGGHFLRFAFLKNCPASRWREVEEHTPTTLQVRPKVPPLFDVADKIVGYLPTDLAWPPRKNAAARAARNDELELLDNQSLVARFLESDTLRSQRFISCAKLQTRRWRKSFNCCQQMPLDVEIPTAKLAELRALPTSADWGEPAPTVDESLVRMWAFPDTALTGDIYNW